MSLAEEADAFCSQLQRRQIKGSLATAKRTAIFLRLLITSRRHADAQALLDDVRLWGTKLQTAKPFSECQTCLYASGHLHIDSCHCSRWSTTPACAQTLLMIPALQRYQADSPPHAELVIGNIVRRVLHIIREESQQVTPFMDFARSMLADVLLVRDGRMNDQQPMPYHSANPHVPSKLPAHSIHSQLAFNLLCTRQELDVKPQEPSEEQLEGSVSRPGLLAKALQSPAFPSRAVSLLNLLDGPPPAAQMQAPPTVRPRCDQTLPLRPGARHACFRSRYNGWHSMGLHQLPRCRLPHSEPPEVELWLSDCACMANTISSHCPAACDDKVLHGLSGSALQCLV